VDDRHVLVPPLKEIHNEWIVWAALDQPDDVFVEML
jgi:hypothetical protein